jgi:uncharacterized membrane protein
MGIIKIAGVVLLVIGVIWLLGDNFYYVFLLGLLTVVILIIVRLLAILYWYGKDKGEW